MAKINWNDPEQVKAYRREYARQRYWTDPEYRERRKKQAREWREKNARQMDADMTLAMLAPAVRIGKVLARSDG